MLLTKFKNIIERDPHTTFIIVHDGHNHDGLLGKCKRETFDSKVYFTPDDTNIPSCKMDMKYIYPYVNGEIVEDDVQDAMKRSVWVGDMVYYSYKSGTSGPIISIIGKVVTIYPSGLIAISISEKSRTRPSKKTVRSRSLNNVLKLPVSNEDLVLFLLQN